MNMNLKPKKCRRCKAEFKPKTEWQKYCSALCRGRVANDRKLELIRRAQKIIAAQQGGEI